MPTTPKVETLAYLEISVHDYADILDIWGNDEVYTVNDVLSSLVALGLRKFRQDLPALQEQANQNKETQPCRSDSLIM